MWPRVFGQTRRRAAIAAAAVLTATAFAGGGVTAAAAGGPPTPVVVPPSDGSYNRLSVAWWKYALEQPNAENPLLDPTGAGCRQHQSGRVFFLVGTAGGGTATRDDCVVPLGSFLFFPLVNAFDVSTPGDGLGTPDLIWHDLQVTLAYRAESLYATVDGKPVGRLDPATSPYRGCAGPVPGCAAPFSFQFPADNLFGLPAGTYAPAVADGFYLLLPPLTPGPHTITFGGTGNLNTGGPDGTFSVDVVYHLRVGR